MNPQKTGALIATLRKEKGMTQKDLAKELGVSRTTLWRMRKRQEAAREREDGER